MPFNSFAFLYFFALVYPLYLSLAHRAQNLLLLAASYLFYGWWDWRFLALLLATTAVDYACGLRLGAAASLRSRRLVLAASLAVNFGALAYFKYAGFFLDALADLSLAPLSAASRSVLAVVLPAGISFYTFQSVSYVLDVYRGRLAPARDPLAFALFVAFFPHLIAGPIMRAEALLPQVVRPRQVGTAGVAEGLFLLAFGYFKKTVVADNLAPFVGAMRHPGSLSGGELLVGLYCMAFFLYADFAGYSDIARGLGKLMGFELTANFRMPLYAQSPADFWRRWHVTLSDWFRDYVFGPLVRLRAKERRNGPWLLTCVVLTLLLCGLWHGAAWNFVAFGLYHGLLLAGYFAARPLLRRMWRAAGLARGVQRVVANVAAFHLVSAAAVFFFLPHPASWRLLGLGLVHGAYDAAALPGLMTLAAFVLPMAAVELAQEASGDDLVFARGGNKALLPALGLLAAGIFLAGATDTHAFVYFQF